MQYAKKEYKKFNKNIYSDFILATDIGGTNSSFGFFAIKKNISELIAGFNFKSNEMKNLHNAVNEVLNSIGQNYRIRIAKACFGVAGVVSNGNKQARITKLNWNLSSKKIAKETGLKKIKFINDFEAIGYGINIIKKNQYITIKKGIKIPKSNILVIGAGTGLGKTLLVYDEEKKNYKPIASEAGHMDFPAQTEDEIRLIEFVKRRNKIRQNVSYEQVLSGPGLKNIYLYLRKSGKFRNTKYAKEIGKSSCNPELISKYRKNDETSKAAFGIFRNNYAKFARDMALDSLSSGGIFIAGGIAPKNMDILGSKFIKIFGQSNDRAYILKRMPIKLISDQSIGLLGAGLAGAKLLK